MNATCTFFFRVIHWTLVDLTALSLAFTALLLRDVLLREDEWTSAVLPLPHGALHPNTYSIVTQSSDGCTALHLSLYRLYLEQKRKMVRRAKAQNGVESRSAKCCGE